MQTSRKEVVFTEAERCLHLVSICAYLPLSPMADLEFLTTQRLPNLQNSSRAKPAPSKQHSQCLPCRSPRWSETPVKSTKVQRILSRSQLGWFEHRPPVKGHVLSVVCKGGQGKQAFLFQIQTSDTVCAAAGENTFLFSCCKERPSPALPAPDGRQHSVQSKTCFVNPAPQNHHINSQENRGSAVGWCRDSLPTTRLCEPQPRLVLNQERMIFPLCCSSGGSGHSRGCRAASPAPSAAVRAGCGWWGLAKEKAGKNLLLSDFKG